MISYMGVRTFWVFGKGWDGSEAGGEDKIPTEMGEIDAVWEME